MFDRIDIHIEVPHVDYEKLSNDRLGEPSDVIHEHVQLTQDRQLTRFKNSANGIAANADMQVAEVRQFYKLDEGGESLMHSVKSQLQLSLRGYQRVHKLARMIEDLAGSEGI